MNFPQTLHLFCRVVDNYGDIGICWRLARQLQQEHALAVTLWVDDLASFRRICPDVATGLDMQQIAGVTVRHWSTQDGAFAANDVADIVIEFFAVDLPPAYIAAMAECNPRPIWFNLEGLSAEAWVEGCHTLPSSHTRLPLTKHFFFPGFTDKTGGLLQEAALQTQRQQFQSDAAAMQTFLAQFGLTQAEMKALKISLFCYPHAPVQSLFDTWQNGHDVITCLIPEGVAVEATQAFLDMPATVGAYRTCGALTVRVLPFVAQPDYDRLLWACDFNFVRGEDSWVRAQWACKPFVWHIYPQNENLHHVKLRAFLQRYAENLPALQTFSLCWNDACQNDGAERIDWSGLWPLFQAEMPEIERRSVDWQQKMQEYGDLASNLLKFAVMLRMEAEKK